MAAGDVLSDDDIDVMLRDLLDDRPAAPGWERGQRRRLLSDIDHRRESSDDERWSDLPDGVVVLRQPSAHSPRRRQRWIVAGAAAALVAAGTLAVAGRRATTTSDAPSLGSSPASELSAATELPVTTDVAHTRPPITGSPTLPAGEPSTWPPVFPVVRAANGEIVQPSTSQIALENPPMTSGVLARLDGDSVVDLVQVTATDSAAYLAAFEKLFGTPSETVIDDVTVLRFPTVDGGPLMLLRAGSDGLAIVIQGWDSEAFLDEAGLDFAVASRDPSLPAGSDLVLSFDRLPAGFEVLASPRALERGAYQPEAHVFPADHSNDPSSGVYISVEPEGSVWPVQAAGSVERVDVDTWWMTGAPVSTYAWRIDSDFWVIIRNARDLATARAWVARIDLVDADEIEFVDGGWRPREPEGATSTEHVVVERPTATTLAGAIDGQSVRVLVANASTVNGVAGRLTQQLSGEFQMLPAVNSGEPSPRDRSIVYYAGGFEDIAVALAERIGGADVLPMPDQLPIEGGNDALIAPDIVDGRGALDILVMLAGDHAREIDEAITP